jgi:hypothetical protein
MKHLVMVVIAAVIKATAGLDVAFKLRLDPNGVTQLTEMAGLQIEPISNAQVIINALTIADVLDLVHYNLAGNSRFLCDGE